MRRAAEIGLFVALALGVLAFGGTEPFYFSIVQATLFGLAILLLLYRDSALTDSGLPWLLPAVVLGLLLLQSTAFSIAPQTTRAYSLLFLSYLTGFYLALLVCRDPAARTRLVLALLAIGTFEAVYGLVQYLTGWQKIFGYPKVFNLQEATGTYINRNHFAGLLEMILPFAISLAIFQLGKAQRIPARHSWSLLASFGRAEFQKMLSLLLVAVVIFVAIFFSHSRMGLLSVLLALLTMTSVASISGRSRRIGLVLATFFLAVGSALVVWIGPEPVLARFETLQQEYAGTQSSRWDVWRDTLKLIQEQPFLGTGLGTFPVAYTSVQTAFLNMFVNHAHNDYLEVAADLGLPGACLVFGSITFLLLQLISRYRATSESARIANLGCLGAICAVLFHSLADFNLYIPANTLVFSCVFGIAYSSLQDQRPSKGQNNP